MSYYPVFLNITNKKCIVCGGGDVAWRKVKALLTDGASVTVVSPEICQGLLDLAQNGYVEILKRAYRDGDLEGAFLAIAATDERGINLSIVAEARRRGCLVRCA